MSASKTLLRLPPLPSAKELIRLYDIRAKKQLSQNFLLDEKLCYKIVNSVGKVSGAHVCEVGPGPGNITRSILHKGAERVDVIEKDRRFLPSLDILRDASEFRLNIHVGDVLTFNMKDILDKEKSKKWDDSPPNMFIIGNLPFNVSTPLIIRWMSEISNKANAWAHGRVKMALTFQKEVAERMVAPPNTDGRCKLSFVCQNWCDIKYAFTLPGRVFVPAPKVDVGVVVFEPLIKPLVPVEFKLASNVSRCLFSFRRKYAKRGAANLFPKSQQDEMVKKLFAVADVPLEMRPYSLSNDDIARICQTYSVMLEDNEELRRFYGKMSTGDIKTIQKWSYFES